MVEKKEDFKNKIIKNGPEFRDLWYFKKVELIILCNKSLKKYEG
jgi:hypothetical protein